jgi:uncharacterized protein DUF6702
VVIWLAGLVLPVFAAAHPMHTAVAELIHDPVGHAVLVTIRVFADDLGAVLGTAQPAAAEAYVRPRVTLADQAGRPIDLRWEGVARAGDVVQMRLRGEVPDGLRGVHVRVTILCERFPDQVNIVRAAYAGRTANLLFTRGDRAKALP